MRLRGVGCNGCGIVTTVDAQELKGQKKAKLELLERHQSQLEALAQQENLLSKSLDSAMDSAKVKTLIDAKRRTRRRSKAVDVDEDYCELFSLILPSLLLAWCPVANMPDACVRCASCFDHVRFGIKWPGIPL